MNDNDEIEVINPKRRRRRRMTALQRKYFGPRRTGRRRARRNPPAYALSVNPRHRRRRSYRRSYRVTTHSRHIRRNPVGNILNTSVEILKDGAIGVVGIAGVNAVGNTLANALSLTDANLRKAVKVGAAVLLPTLVAMVMPAWKRPACLAGSMAVAHVGAQLLEEKVYPMLGNQVNSLLSSERAGFIGPLPATKTKDDMGYLPGVRYLGRGVGYLPGTRYLGRGGFFPSEGYLNTPFDSRVVL
jgi:hypothetical protein